MIQFYPFNFAKSELNKKNVFSILTLFNKKINFIKNFFICIREIKIKKKRKRKEKRKKKNNIYDLFMTFSLIL